MSKPTDSRAYFRVRRKPEPRAGGTVWIERDEWQIVSIAGGDIVADNIPSADLAEAMRKGAEEARK